MERRGEVIMTQNDNPQTTLYSTKSDSAAWPLVVSETNPRYFTVASGNAADRKAIYLTGSHIWHKFHDGMGPGSDRGETSEHLDYDAYLNSARIR